MKTTTCGIAVAALLLAVTGACKKESPRKDDPPPTAPATPDPAATVPDPAAAEAAAKANAEAEEKRKNAERVAESLKELEAESATEAARWTDDLRKKAVALRDKQFKDPRTALKAILASEHRMPGHADRDIYRHPLETLMFFGITPKSTVVEMGAGEGWYTELLAPLLARSGQLIVASPDPNGPADSGRTVYGKRVVKLLGKSPELFGTVKTAIIAPPDKVELGEKGSADLVLAIREMHNWHRRGYLDAYLGAMHAVLKEGGTLGVVQHRAAADANPDESAKKGYLPEKWLIEKIESAGFELAGKSEVNANPKDTKDHPEGVWTLPPNYRLGETDKAKYQAIGESDRMTLKLKKVAVKASEPATAAPAEAK